MASGHPGHRGPIGQRAMFVAEADFSQERALVRRLVVQAMTNSGQPVIPSHATVRLPLSMCFYLSLGLFRSAGNWWTRSFFRSVSPFINTKHTLSSNSLRM